MFEPTPNIVPGQSVASLGHDHITSMSPSPPTQYTHAQSSISLNIRSLPPAVKIGLPAPLDAYGTLYLSGATAGDVHPFLGRKHVART
jgi:hypothetical protein